MSDSEHPTIAFASLSCSPEGIDPRAGVLLLVLLPGSGYTRPALAAYLQSHAKEKHAAHSQLDPGNNGFGVFAGAVSAQEVLPFPPTPTASIAGRTMQESVYHRRVEPRRLPAEAPNILVVLIDDAGPGLPSTYGGEVRTPTLDRIAKAGISYNRFHTTAMCSPTRAALLTGRNHHRVGNGQIAELANDWDGYSGTIPKSCATGAEVLRNYGYKTAAFGKWHNTPAEQTTAAGPFDYWPTGYGFEYFTASSRAKLRNTNRTSCGTPPSFRRPRRPNKAIT